MIVSDSRCSLRHKAIGVIRRICYVLLVGIVLFRFWVASNGLAHARYSVKTSYEERGTAKLVNQSKQ